MPYRVDIPAPPADALDRLLALGALDVEPITGGLAALMPDGVDVDRVARELGVDAVVTSPAVGRDDGSTWVLTPRPVRAGRLLIVPADMTAPLTTLYPEAPGSTATVLNLIDSGIFGSGLHPTTALSLELLDALLETERPASMLDVGTGSGVLALAALMLGVPTAIGLDIDPDALVVATENALINGLSSRFQAVHGGPDAVDGVWPLVVANILAAPLIELAPALVRRVGSRGQLVLAGLVTSTAADTESAYRRFGLHLRTRMSRAGWTAVVLSASW